MVRTAGPLEQNQPVPHFLDYVDAQLPAVKVVIPSFDRPEQLCRTTLRLIQQNSVPLENVAVFVAPGRAPGHTMPEWQRYLDALRSFGLAEVRLVEGGRGLVANMNAALEWVGSGYFITMSDSVTDIQEVYRDRNRNAKLRPLRRKGLHALICHGRTLLAEGGLVAWGLCASHSARCMKEGQLSRKLGAAGWKLVWMSAPKRLAGDDCAPGEGSHLRGGVDGQSLGAGIPLRTLQRTCCKARVLKTWWAGQSVPISCCPQAGGERRHSGSGSRAAAGG